MFIVFLRSLDSNIKWVTSNNTYLNIIKIFNKLFEKINTIKMGNLVVTSTRKKGNFKFTSQYRKITLLICSTLALIAIPKPTACKLACRVEQIEGYNFSIKGKKVPACQTRCTTLHNRLDLKNWTIFWRKLVFHSFLFFCLVWWVRPCLKL